MSQHTPGGTAVFAPLLFAMEKIGGVWKMPILWRLQNDPLRYSELKRRLPAISDKVLTSKLRDLEADGFVHRKVYPVVPPKTEYSLTEKGRSVLSLIRQFRAYGVWMMREEGVVSNGKRSA